MAATQNDTVVGIVLVALGGLALLEWIDLGWLVTVAAVVALVVGILMLAGQANGSPTQAIVLVVAGVLLLAPNVVGAALASLLATAAAVLLLVVGILKLTGKW